jgi:hypothetical protein
MTKGPKDPKKPVEVPPGETPDSLPDSPGRPLEEPGPDAVPQEAPGEIDVLGAVTRPCAALRSSDAAHDLLGYTTGS